MKPKLISEWYYTLYYYYIANDEDEDVLEDVVEKHNLIFNLKDVKTVSTRSGKDGCFILLRDMDGVLYHIVDHFLLFSSILTKFNIEQKNSHNSNFKNFIN